MNLTERKGLTHPVVPGIQRIMMVQSEPVRARVLIEAYRYKGSVRFVDLWDKVQAVLGRQSHSSL